MKSLETGQAVSEKKTLKDYMILSMYKAHVQRAYNCKVTKF